ncbi:hypothetical protein LJB92_00815 [Bacteroidales bacterium OttesenSCG-928-M06]|nr:hypothetical protein [Bacteroidales bacterium OttesenSCG-928-M06]
MSDEFLYDDEAAVKFIRNYLPQELKSRFSDDDIYYFLDVICDFYEKRDWLTDDDEEQEEKELILFIIKQATKDKIGEFTNDEIHLFLTAEAAYSDTLDFPE